MKLQWLRPKTDKIISTDIVKLWKVRWTSRQGTYSDDTHPEIEAFTSEESANIFAQSLRDAFALLRFTGGALIVTVE